MAFAERYIDMRFLHLSDLHIGKRVNEFSMLEDQKYILNQILGIIEKEKVDGVWIAGDVYDKAVPSAEAVCLFDEFLTRLAEKCKSVFVISGNHDSAERVAYGGRLLSNCGIYVSPVYDGALEPVVLSDPEEADIKVAVYMLPFIKPVHVRHVYSEEEITSYTEAVRIALSAVKLDSNRKNVLLAHQFVTGAQRTESEEVSVGGLDNVDASVLAGFDYVALGHIHKAQMIGRETIRYCGTPLAYSYSEADTEKTVTIVDILDTISVREVPLQPLRKMRIVRGTYMEVTARSFYQSDSVEDYLKVILTDEEEIPDAIGKLRTIYPNIMQMEYDNVRTRTRQEVGAAEAVEQKSPLQLFEELYRKQNNQDMSAVQKEYVQELVEEIWK